MLKSVRHQIGHWTFVPSAHELRSGSARARLQQRWVLWSGNPELVLVARDRAGQTVWSGAIFGAEGEFPAKISDKIGQFSAFARTQRSS